MRLRIIVAAIAATALAIPATAGAAEGNREEVKVMDRNLYLGADLGPAVGAPSIPAAIDGAGVVYNQLVRTNWPERVVELGDEIKREKPHLVGLQEVALWQEQTPSDLGGPPITSGTPATEVKYDFLADLMDQLGSKYRVVGVQPAFTGELPADVDGEDEPGTVAGEDLDIRLTMRDVILARKGVKTKKVKSGNYEARFETDIGGVPVFADRGWVSTMAKVGDASFKFVDTHLESFDDGTIRAAQARELKAKVLKGKKPIVVVGDLNSDPKGTEPDDLSLAYRVFEKAGFVRRALPGRTYGHTAELNDPNDLGGFVKTIDFVLVSDPKIKLDKKSSAVLGLDPSQLTPSGLWPSDHAGLVSALLFP